MNLVGSPADRIPIFGAGDSVQIFGHRGALSDWWDPNNDGLCIWAAYQPKSAASFAVSLVDLSGNGNNAGDPGAANRPVFDTAQGWGFVGANDYLTTTFICALDQSQSAIAQFVGANTGVGVRSLFGYYEGADRRFSAESQYNGTNTYFNNGSFVGPLVVGAATGNFCIAGNQGYWNGVATGGVIAAGVTAYTDSAWIGCRRRRDLGAGNFDQGFIGWIVALAIYDCVLTAPQVLAIATAMAAL